MTNIDPSGSLNWTVYYFFTDSTSCGGGSCYTERSTMYHTNSDTYYYFCNQY